MGNAPLRQIIVVALAIAGAAALFVSISWSVMALTDMSFKDAASSVQSIGTLVVLSVGGALAYYRFEMFRSFEPHLTITHEISHRRVGDGFVHMAVNANLSNNSRVKLDIDRCLLVIQLISPTTDSEIVRLYLQTFGSDRYETVHWPTLEYVPREWDSSLVVEPGESHRETFEAIVDRDVRTVLIYTYFYNSSSRGADGWDTMTVYDIVSA